MIKRLPRWAQNIVGMCSLLAIVLAALTVFGALVLWDESVQRWPANTCIMTASSNIVCGVQVN
jgi:hypothetical protein